MKTIEKITNALENGKSVYIHALGKIGNGMRIDPDRECYLTKYVYDEYPGTYYGVFDNTLSNIDGRRRIEVL